MKKISDTSDGIPMFGTLSIAVRDAKTNKIIQTRTIRNKITFLTGDVLIELLCQRSTDPAPAKDLIYSLRVGTGTSPAQRSDTNLGSTVFGVALGDVDKVSGASGTVTFVGTLGTGDSNGYSLTEAGLFTAGVSRSVSDPPGTSPGSTRMLARQIYPAIAKTSSISVDYSWSISFTSLP